MDNVRKLIDRLLVIYGEENAGNHAYHNEKVGIMDMLNIKFLFHLKQGHFLLHFQNLCY